jgi:hypothetical protein
VSRAGILFINESDIGWRPMVETWLGAQRMDDVIRSHLPSLFDKYVEVLGTSFDFKRLKASIPIMLISQVTTVIRLLEGFMEKISKDCKRPIAEVLEQHFFLAVAWAFGGALMVESSEGARGDHRRTFHDMLLGLSANAVKLPKIEGKEDALVFDFFFDPEAEDFRLWGDVVSKYVVVPIGSNPGEQSFSSLVVPTVDSTRLDPTDTAAAWLALVVAAPRVLRPNSNLTTVFTPQATSALVSSYTGTEATSEPPTNQPTVSNCVTSGTLRKRYFLATAYSRYCASALVAHGGPYVWPPAHVERSKLTSK